MIQLDCPNCSAKLEIDEGFRGGVCRCYECGTLMTVPDDPKQSTAEPLFHQGRSAPPPASPKSTSSTPPIQYSATPAPQKSAQAITLHTASGKEVKVSATMLEATPIAKRRQLVRRTTQSGVILLMLALTLAVIFGSIKLFSSKIATQKEEVTAAEAHSEVFGVTENPFLEKGATLMGVPIGRRTVFLIDASIAMRRSFEWSKTLAAVAASRLASDQWFQVVIASDSGLFRYPKDMTPGMAIDPERVRDQLSGTTPTGAVHLRQAIDQAMQGTPDNLFLIASQLPDSEIELLREKCNQLQLNIILIDNDSFGEDSPLAQLARNNGGRLIPIHAARLETWYEEYLDHDANRAASPDQ